MSNVDIQHVQRVLAVAKEKSDILNGTLALMTLRTIEALGPIHGYGIGRRIEQVSEGVLKLNQGTLYPMLLQLQQAGWISSKWGISDTGRKAKFYSITKAGKKQLVEEAENWRRIATVVERFAQSTGEI